MFVDALEVAHATNTNYRSTDVARSNVTLLSDTLTLAWLV
jgi:hypothetical protein